MKFNFFKYIFILIVLCLICTAFYKIKTDEVEQTNTVSTNQKQIKEINIGIAMYDSFNPYVTNNKNMQEIISIVYPGAVEIKQDFKPNYLLVDSITKVNDIEYIVNLRNNLYFSDGTKLDSSDIVSSYEIALSTQNLYSEIVSQIQSLDSRDEKTLVIKLNKQTPFVEYYLTFPIVKASSYQTDPVPIGIGQYKVDSFDDTCFFLNQNENYINHDDEEILEKIIITKYNSLNDMYNKFKLGTLDVISTNNANIKDYIGKVGYNENQVSDKEHIFLAFNTRTSLFSNQEIRKAICYAIDKDSLITSSMVSSSFPLDYGTWVCENIQSSSLGYNLDTANELLVNNGYVLTKGIYQKSVNKKKENLTFKILVNSNNTDMIDIANSIALQLNNAGILATVDMKNQEAYENAINARAFDLVLCEYVQNYIPDLDLFFGEDNLSGFTSDEIDDIYDQLKKANNDEKVLIYQKFFDVYKNYGAYLSIGNRKKTIAYSQNLIGEFAPNWYSPYNHISTWYK